MLNVQITKSTDSVTKLAKPFTENGSVKKKIPNFLCRLRKGHSPFLYPNRVYVHFTFVGMSAHTLLGTFILMLRFVEYTLCLDQLYGVTVVLLSSLCTHVPHFVVTIHTLLCPDLWNIHFVLINCTAVQS